MRNIIKLIPLMAIASLSLSGVAMAKEKAVQLNEKAVNVKCFVELVGGGETISLWLVKPSLLKGFSRSIVGRDILPLTNNSQINSKKKSTIYKAMQCVLEENDFTSARARAMDKESPR